MYERLESRHRQGDYIEYTAPSKLRRYLRCAWIHRVAERPTAPHHRVLPEMGVSLSFDCARDAQGRISEAQVYFLGPVHSYRSHALELNREMASVMLRAEMAHLLLGVSPLEHIDAMTPLSDINTPLAADLMARLHETHSVGQSVDILLNKITMLVKQQGLSSALTRREAVFNRLSDRQAAVNMDCAANELNITHRHMRRLVGETIGLGPRRCARIWRLQRTVESIDHVTRPSWAQLAVENGYYDQSHMIRDFREFAGASPKTVHGERLAESPLATPSQAANKNDADMYSLGRSNDAVSVA